MVTASAKLAKKRKRGTVEKEMLDPYQLEGAEFLAARKRAGLYDEMGLGKTPQAIRAADTIGAKKILVLCPAIARFNWAREFKKFEKKRRASQVVLSGDTFIQRGEGAVVVNYELLVTSKGLYNQLIIQQWDAIVLDEGHFLKDPDSKRTRVVFGPECEGEAGALIAQATYAWTMTGTPVPNNASELWPTLRAMAAHLCRPIKVSTVDADPNEPMNFWRFVRAFCVVAENRYGKPVVKGNKNAPVLRERLREFALRRTWKDVEHELPPMSMADYALNFDEALDDLLAMEGAVVPYIDLDSITDQTPLSDLIDSEHVATIRSITAAVKAKQAAELFKEEWSQHEEKSVIMIWHKAAADILAEELAEFGVVRITGSETAKQKQAAVDAFENDPKVRGAICHIKAAGTAINLVAGRFIEFVEMHWTPGDNAQALKRIHRRGQTKHTRARCMYIPNSIDEAVTSVLRRKTAAIYELIDE